MKQSPGFIVLFQEGVFPMKRIFAGTLLALLIAIPAFAVTAGDVLDKMTDKERGGYLSGAVEMAIVLASNQGNAKKAECITTWYYSTEGAQKTVIAAFDRYKDKPAASVLAALINRQCGQ